LSISGYIFFILISYENFVNFKKLYDHDSEFRSIKTYNKEIIQTNSKQVVWVVFDEFDPLIAFDYRVLKFLKNFEKFKETSFVGNRIYPPAKDTINSMPAQLMGLHTSGNVVDDSGKYFLKEKLTNKKIQFNYENSIFFLLKLKKLTSVIYSTPLNYCQYINITNCIYVGKKITLFDSSAILSGTVLFIKFINPFDKFSVLQKKLSKITNYKTLEFTNDKTLEFTNDNSLEIANNFLRSKDWENLNINFSNNYINDFDGRFLVNDQVLINTLNDNINLIFIHIYLPHLPATHAKKFLKINTSNYLEDYIVNLKMADLVLGSIIKTIEKKENIMLITSSDHWLRQKDRNTNNYYPALFIAKILGDNNAVEFNENSNLIYIKDIIFDYLNNEILNHADIKNKFNSRIDNTVPFIK